ncbi:calcium-binding tyrosine phosphorylation-regulated protein-like [Engraulis encrasicolus]|uniref:calcium-binding tyrosine phosphorylation-regulated protein-like n=1 Tax=Engraulis encrasicolus TaxID=184585 RepID=UPI002FCF0EBB
MAEWKVSRPTLLIPYGVRSFLESVCRAYRIEDPRDIRQFLADYCKDLLENRDRSPSKDLKQAIRIYQKMRERDQVTIKSWSPQDSPNEPITPSPFGEQAEICEDDDEEEDEEDDEDERSCPAVSVSIVSCRLTHDAWKNCETMYDDQAPLESPGPVSSGDIPAARVLSAVFRKVPSRSDSFTETQGAVLIDSASAPPDDVIVVHSENLPNAIVFHVDSHPSSASSVRSCASKTQSLTDAKVTEECGVEVAQDPVVVFERVLFTDEYQSSSLVERDEPQSLEVTDQPLTSVEGDQSSGTPLGMESDVQTLTAPVVVKQASPKRSLVRVYSAHLVNPEDRKGSSQPDKKPSPAPSSKTSLTSVIADYVPAVADIK